MESATSHPAHPYRPHLAPDPGMTTSQLDEGYSDGADTRSQPDSDMAFTGDTLTDKGDSQYQTVLEAAMGMSDEKRKQLVLVLISSLDNKSKLDVNRYIKNLTHFDPALYLPAELVLNVFSYLSPKDLLTASQVSRAWRVRSQENNLWRTCFAREGWVVDKGRLEEFEQKLEFDAKSSKWAASKRTQGDEGAIASSLQRRESRKRTRVEAFSDGETSGSGMEGVDGLTDKQIAALHHAADGMEGVESTSGLSTQAQTGSEGDIRATADNVQGTPISASTTYEAYQRRYSIDTLSYPTFNPPPSPADIQLEPPMLASSNKLNWQYLYKHRRKLEDNWDRGRFKTFSLPHPDHPEDGHSECIYTIQHTTNTLVSGSRDRTIRIWDLDTCRLKRLPLEGHEASVLCLQFDDRVEQDLIVSGGSDAMLIVWKFSTGEIIKMLRQAHDESVLNLRFDDRYIVTCSKDKTIKIWNRHALERSETSTDIPAHVIGRFMDPAQGMGGTGLLIEPFTLLTTLRQHHAAVNAVMIHGNIIVSASGDRTTKAWDLHTGDVVKNFVGHTKGIACVQFDGRRIVSGSSDQTVRIYDAASQAEVACLTGHHHLVRTVQARFGDLDIISDEELERQARQADRNFLQRLGEGMQPAALGRNTRRNAGSSRPEDMLAVGARVPPSGGGTRWAKIVSGSYDESLIVWRREGRDGQWTKKQQLNLGSLLRQNRARRQPAVPVPVAPLHAIQAANAAGANQQQNNAQNAAAALAAAQNGLAVAQHANAILQQQAGPNAQGAATALALGQQLAQLGQHMRQIAPGAANTVAINQAGQTLATTQNNAPAPANPTAATANPQQPLPNVPVGQNPHAAAQAQAPPAGQPARTNTDSMRVFKLQFDARRIICCSQNKVIVGWDFADGDQGLELVGSLSNETS